MAGRGGPVNGVHRRQPGGGRAVQDGGQPGRPRLVEPGVTASCAVSVVRQSLPSAVRGSALVNSQRTGTLCQREPGPAVLGEVRTAADGSGADSRIAAATISSQNRGQAAPTTATSATAGWREQHLLDLLRRNGLAAPDDQRCLRHDVVDS